MKKKKDGTVKTLVLSIISLMIGLVWIEASITVISSYSNIPAPRMAVLFVISAVFLGLGIWGMLRWRRMRIAGGQKAGKAIPIVLGIAGVLLILQMCITLPQTRTTGILLTQLKEYVKDDFTDENAKMPEDPWFVFYNNGIFGVPSADYKRGTDDPSKVNVVVMYEEGTRASGIWVDKDSGKNLGDAMEQYVKIYVVRLEDWALIDEITFSEQLKNGENGMNVTAMHQVENYLNDLIK